MILNSYCIHYLVILFIYSIWVKIFVFAQISSFKLEVFVNTEYQQRTNTNIGSFFIFARLQRRFRVEEMAEELGISSKLLLKLENNASKVSLNKILKIVSKLNKNERVELQHVLVSASMSIQLY